MNADNRDTVHEIQDTVLSPLRTRNTRKNNQLSIILDQCQGPPERLFLNPAPCFGRYSLVGFGEFRDKLKYERRRLGGCDSPPSRTSQIKSEIFACEIRAHRVECIVPQAPTEMRRRYAHKKSTARRPKNKPQGVGCTRYGWSPVGGACGTPRGKRGPCCEKTPQTRISYNRDMIRAMPNRCQARNGDFGTSLTEHRDEIAWTRHRDEFCRLSVD